MDAFSDIFDIDLDRFLTVVMTNENYQFFIKSNNLQKTTYNINKTTNVVNEESPEYTVSKSDIVDNLIKLKYTDDREEKYLIIDKIINSYAKVLEENSLLKSEINKYQSFLIEKIKGF